MSRHIKLTHSHLSQKSEVSVHDSASMKTLLNKVKGWLTRLHHKMPWFRLYGQAENSKLWSS